MCPIQFIWKIYHAASQFENIKYCFNCYLCFGCCCCCCCSYSSRLAAVTHHHTLESSRPDESTWSSPPAGPSCWGRGWQRSFGTRGTWLLSWTELYSPPYGSVCVCVCVCVCVWGGVGRKTHRNRRERQWDRGRVNQLIKPQSFTLIKYRF